MIFTILKYVCLLFAITYTFSNAVKWSRGHEIAGVNMVIMALSITGFIVLQFELGY